MELWTRGNWTSGDGTIFPSRKDYLLDPEFSPNFNDSFIRNLTHSFVLKMVENIQTKKEKDGKVKHPKFGVRKWYDAENRELRAPVLPTEIQVKV